MPMTIILGEGRGRNKEQGSRNRQKTIGGEQAETGRKEQGKAQLKKKLKKLTAHPPSLT